MSSISFSLSQLGWRPFFSQQLSFEELGSLTAARVVGVQRSGIQVLAEQGAFDATLPGNVLAADAVPTVGDWVVVDVATARIVRTLDRQSVIARGAAGDTARRQLIAANIDTLFVVTSCNDDFNVSRLERYFALAYEARVEPVVVLTKADLCADADSFLDELRAVAPRVIAIAINAMDRDALAALSPWLAPGQTIAFVGSSGVGKSTLVNTLLGADRQSTGGIREHDSKGRHTTTSRQMLALPSGAWVIDTPGMRELKIGAVEEGVRTVFDDIETLAQSCRFRDCSHRSETDCAVLAAVANGQLDERRLRSYHKLQREAANAARTTHERHAIERKFGRMVKSAIELKRRDR
jgi:ribosome biogenesis GTPase